MLVLPESIGRGAGEQLRGSEVLRDGQRILDIAVGRSEVVLAICRQCPQVVHVRVLRGNLPQCIKGYDRFLQLVRGDLCPRGVATGNRIPRLDGDYASVGPLGRVIIVFGKGEIALNCMTLGSFGASVSASASRRWAEGRSPVAMNTRAEAISPLRTDSLPFVSKSYWPENADDAIMDAP